MTDKPTADIHNLDVREATRDDAAVVALLIDAMDTHYRGAGNTGGVAAARIMVETCLAEREGTRFLIATLGSELVGGEPVGLACFAIVRPGRRHAGLVFLKDLFVIASARSAGVGAALLAELARYARDRRIGRIDLTTDTENLRSQKLYASLGARRQQKVAYTIEGDTLAALASKAERG